MAKIKIGNVKGKDGDNGVRGSKWYEGTAITGNSKTATVFSNSGITDALIDDYYLNTTTRYIYKCTTAGDASTAKWEYMTCLSFIDGDTWDSSTTYEPVTIVRHNGASYFSLKKSVGQEPSESSIYWRLIAKDGADIVIDSELSDTSENSVQNKIIKAQIDSLNQAIEDAKALKASLEQYGMVKLNDTSVVTDSIGLALPTTEKNPNIDGTLANQISQLNTNLDSLSSIKIHHDGKWKEDTSQFSIYYYEGANTDTYDLPYPHCFVVVYKQFQGARGIALAYKWNNDGESLNNSIIWMNKLHEYREWQGWYRILGTQCNITQPIANCSVFEYTTFYVVNFGYAKPSDVPITTLCPYADERAFASGMTFLGNICLSVDPDTKIEPVRVYIEYSGNIKIYSFTEKVFLDTYIIGQITVPKKQSI